MWFHRCSSLLVISYLTRPWRVAVKMMCCSCRGRVWQASWNTITCGRPPTAMFNRSAKCFLAIILAKFFCFSVSVITREPPHVAWWNSVRMWTLTIVRTFLNFTVLLKGQGHMSFLYAFGVPDTMATFALVQVSCILMSDWLYCLCTEAHQSCWSWTQTETSLHSSLVRQQYLLLCFH